MRDRGDWYSSLDPNGRCEGQELVGLLGRVFTAPPDGVPPRPVYRCDAGGDHFDALPADCEGELRGARLGHLIK